jgi:hypothetical protein
VKARSRQHVSKWREVMVGGGDGLRDRTGALGQFASSALDGTERG